MTSSRDYRLPGWLIPVTTGLLAALSAAGGTFALWHDASRPTPEFIGTGHLAITALADPVWQDTSHPVPQEIDPTDFHVRRGDSLRVSIPVETTLDGTNLAAQLTVQLAADAALPAGVQANYQLLDARGTPLTPGALPLNTLSPVPIIDGTHYTVRIDLDFTGSQEVPVPSPKTDRPPADPLATLDGIDVVIHQVRDGNDAS